MKFNLAKLMMLASKFTIRIFLLHAIAFQFAFAESSSGQDLEDIKVNVNFQGASLQEVFEEIKQQTQLRFAYNTDEIRDAGPYNFRYKKVSVKALLKEISRQSQLEFKQIDKTISVKKKAKVYDSAPKAVQQDSLIRGRIVDADSNEPLIGATVQIANTAQGVITDINGEFKLNIGGLNVKTIVISYLGFQNQTITFEYTHDLYFNIALIPKTSALNEVVVIGYGTKGKRELTNSVVSIKADEFQNQPVISFDQALAGKLAGVQVSETTGAPGSGLSIRIRGTSSITAGNDPLYVVDGVPISDRVGNAAGTIESYTDAPINPLNTININDIASIDILKDAAATSIYGSRGSNGVVIIKTKSGRPGKTKLSYNSYIGTSNVTRKLDMMDAYEYSRLKFDGHNNSYLDFLQDNGLSGSVSDPNTVRAANGAASDVYNIAPEIVPYVNNAGGLTNTDWQDAIFRNATIQSHTISASGGSKSVTYFLSGTYLDQEGIVIGSGYEQYSARFNLNVQEGIFNFGFNLSPSRSIHDRVKAEGPYWADGVIGTALVSAPIFPVYNQDGSFAFDQQSWEFSDSYINPVALAELIQNDIFHNRFFGNVYFEAEPVERLRFRTSVGTDINGFNREYFRPKSLPERNLDPDATPGDGRSRSENLINWTFEQTVNYDFQFARDHSIGLLGGASLQQETQDENFINIRDFPNDFVSTLNAGTTITNAGSRRSAWSLLSYFTRLQYNFKNKYFISATIRTDGSSRFGQDSRWGTFPSASLGWVASSEPFLYNSEVLSFLKLRASYGVTGNFNIGNSEWLSEIAEQNYVLGEGTDNEVVGVAPGSLGNNNLRWERTATIDLGVEIGLFDDRVFIEADYYKSSTSDLLLNVPVPEITGFSSAIQNIGEVENSGFELAVNLNNTFGKLTWDLGFNFSTNVNEVRSLGVENAPIIVRGGSEGALYITRVGSPISSYYTYVRDGIFQSEEEINSSPHLEGTRPGDVRIKDLNEDGQITEEDRAITGNYFPDYTFGINSRVTFKGVDLGIQVQGVQGNEVMNLFRRYGFNMEGHQNNFVGAENRWQSPDQPGDGQTVRANRVQTPHNRLISDWMVEDASFIRIRTITIGYSLPKELISKASLTNVRLYVTAQNPFTFTDYIGYNPEVSGKYQNNNALLLGEDYGTYPLARTISFGLNLDF